MKKCHICLEDRDGIVEISDCNSCHKIVCFLCIDDELSVAIGDKVCFKCSKKYSLRNPIY